MSGSKQGLDEGVDGGVGGCGALGLGSEGRGGVGREGSERRRGRKEGVGREGLEAAVRYGLAFQASKGAAWAGLGLRVRD